MKYRPYKMRLYGVIKIKNIYLTFCKNVFNKINICQSKSIIEKVNTEKIICDFRLTRKNDGAFHESWTELFC